MSCVMSKSAIVFFWITRRCAFSICSRCVVQANPEQCAAPNSDGVDVVGVIGVPFRPPHGRALRSAEKGSDLPRLGWLSRVTGHSGRRYRTRVARSFRRRIFPKRMLPIESLFDEDSLLSRIGIFQVVPDVLEHFFCAGVGQPLASTLNGVAIQEGFDCQCAYHVFVWCFRHQPPAEQGVGGQPPGKSYLESESWGGGATTIAFAKKEPAPE